ncbi:MAG: citramalate synthase [Eubacteriales bacterium]
MKIKIFDTTLRDGAQGAGISFTGDDRERIAHTLGGLGIYCTEAGYFSGSEADISLCRRLSAASGGMEISAFCGTRHIGKSVCDSAALTALAKSDIQCATLFGKASLYQVRTILRTEPEENLAMIRESVAYLSDSGKKVYFDAEHFFDGYSDNPAYALKTVETAFAAGARAVILCDTNGGMLPDVIGMTVAAVRKHFPEGEIGIHCHNDIGMAEACSVAAVLSGATIVSGTISGMGERCGNANLNTLIPLLQLKLGFSCIPDGALRSLTRSARHINEIANLSFDESEPFVGGYAFTHKAGTHIDAVGKDPRSFEHIDPADVGNSRNILISGLAGRAAVIAKTMTAPGDIPDKDDERVIRAVRRIKELEARGYSYEDAEASLSLVIRREMGIGDGDFFDLVRFSVTINEGTYLAPDEKSCAALIKIRVGDRSEITAAEGDGPVNALDLALRRALASFYPEVGNMRLSDYKVRVLNSNTATASVVRVSIETTDGVHIWRTVGVSNDIIEASRQALVDAFRYRLIEMHGTEPART